jgi:pimeloyl-ACP methyl ester carboxylesterase
MAIRLVPFCAALLMLGCGRSAPLSPELIQSRATHSPQAKAGGAFQAPGEPRHVAGSIGPGALYEISVPANWNGDLVLYAHGYSLPQLPVEIPHNQDSYSGIRDLLLQQGFAVAVSSYSENGYAEAEGARQVHQLRGLFVSSFGRPSRAFLMGQSLGGLIAIDLAESHSHEYAGALIVSGVLGGTSRQVNYIGDVRVVFDCLWPGLLSGTVTQIPEGAFPQNAVIQALAGDPNKLGALLCTFRDPGFRLPGRNGPEFVQSAVRALGFDWLGAGDLRGRTHGHELYDNVGVTYGGCAPQPVLDQLNGCVARFAATADAQAEMRNHYEPSGALQIPVLTIHAELDPIVPAGHEAVYAAKVAQSGSLNWLLTCIVPRYGHTEAFRPVEVVQAFDALVGWVNSGQKPSCPVFPTP